MDEPPKCLPVCKRTDRRQLGWRKRHGWWEKAYTNHLCMVILLMVLVLRNERYFLELFSATTVMHTTCFEGHNSSLQTSKLALELEHELELEPEPEPTVHTADFAGHNISLQTSKLFLELELEPETEPEPIVHTAIFASHNSSLQTSELGLETEQEQEREPEPLLKKNITLPSYFSNPERNYTPMPLKPKSIPIDWVNADDYVYLKGRKEWDGAPVVVEQYKLLFFTVPKVGCTVWKKLFRRIAGFKNWKSHDSKRVLPHNPRFNGLKYLYHYTREQATHMMTSPDWSRAMMVRDPKERFLSAFLDKSVGNFHRHIIEKCCLDESCVEGAQTASGFLELIGKCVDGHWLPQHYRVDNKYWPYIDHILHLESAQDDARNFLMSLDGNGDAWRRFGNSGWGIVYNDNGDKINLSIFESKGVTGAGNHATWAGTKMKKYLNPETEEAIERFYQCDYENPLFNFTRAVCLTCTPGGNMPGSQ